jgi:lipopolysaccharide export system permease protein
MRTTHKMILKAYVPIFFLAELFFLLIIVLVDLFSNLWRYLQNDALLTDILRASLLYLPRAASFALPPALLFSVAFTLGNYQSRNELLAIFASGISLRRFTAPLVLLSVVISVGSFLFHETMVIPTLLEKSLLSDQLTGLSSANNNTNIVIRSEEGRVIYRADYYNAENRTLTNTQVIIRDGDMKFLHRLKSEWAQYIDGQWYFNRTRLFSGGPEGVIEEQYREVYSDQLLSEAPESFRRQVRSVEELNVQEARAWIESLQKTGSEHYQDALTGYYQRFAFMLAPLIVTLLSLSMSGYFRKNILLMSLLFSLIISVVYYVGDMVLGLLARQGYLGALTGAWGSTLLFLAISIFLLRHAKS